MNECLIARLYTDARVQRIYAGTSKIMKEVIWRTVTGRSSCCGLGRRTETLMHLNSFRPQSQKIYRLIPSEQKTAP